MKRVIFLFIYILVPVSIFSQLVPEIDQYIMNPMSINPACAGSRSALGASLIYRNQWVGMEGAPETGTLSIDAPLFGERVGLGLMITTDKIGITKEEMVMSNYSFKVDLGEGFLSFGLGAGMLVTNSKWSDLTVNDQGDDMYLVDSRSFFIPAFRFGILFSGNNYYAGFSIPQFLSYKFDFDKNRYTMYNSFSNYNYLFTSGYTFTLNKNLSLTPSTLLSYLPSEKFRYDFSAQLGYKERMWFGATYSSASTVTGIFRLQINNQLGIGYCYDYNLGTLGKYNNGSHVFMIKYEFRYKIQAVNPLYF